jgi:hypothetical protein
MTQTYGGKPPAEAQPQLQQGLGKKQLQLQQKYAHPSLEVEANI